jgi:hypothetical protein
LLPAGRGIWDPDSQELIRSIRPINTERAGGVGRLSGQHNANAIAWQIQRE